MSKYRNLGFYFENLLAYVSLEGDEKIKRQQKREKIKEKMHFPGGNFFIALIQCVLLATGMS